MMKSELPELGRLLLVLRYRNRELLGDMADKLGIAPWKLSKIEHGFCPPPSDLLIKLREQYQLKDREVYAIKDILQRNVGRQQAAAYLASGRSASFVKD